MNTLFIIFLVTLAVSKEFIYVNEEILVIGSFLTFLTVFYTKGSSFISDALDASLAETKSALLNAVEVQISLSQQALQKLKLLKEGFLAVSPADASSLKAAFIASTLSVAQTIHVDAVTRYILAESTLLAKENTQADIKHLNVSEDVSALYRNIELSVSPRLQIPTGLASVLSFTDALGEFPEDAIVLLSVNCLVLEGL